MAAQQNVNAGRSANQAPAIPGAQVAPPKAPPSSLAAFTAPPAAPDYMALYQQGLNAAKGNIAQRLQGDLGYIQQQQASAGQAIGQLPGGINSAFGQAASSNQNAENAITAAQKASGVGSLTPLGTYMAPVNAALHGTQTALLQNVPLLQIGAQQQAEQERAMALQGASQDQSALQQQQMEFYQQQAQQQAQAKAQQDAANAGAMQNYAYSKLLQDDKDRQYGPTAASTIGTQPVTDAKGIPLGYTPNDIAAVKKSPQYGRMAAELTGAPDPNTQAHIWHELSLIHAKQPALLAALASIFPNGQPPPDPGGYQMANPNQSGLMGFADKVMNNPVSQRLSSLPGGTNFGR